MVEIIVRNPRDTDKTISIVRNSIQYTIPANSEVTIILDDPTKDSIVLE